MTKLEQLQHAIQEANLFRSKLTEPALAVPGLTSLKIRHLMNNIGAISTKFAEIGSHVGGTFCSAIYGNSNLQEVTSVDNFSELFGSENPMPLLLDNVGKFIPEGTKFSLINKDCWGPIENPPRGIDFFMYDGEHSFEAQRDAMTHFVPWLADECIFVVDDYSLWGFPKEGVQTGLKLAQLRHNRNADGYRVIWEQELWDGQEGNNFGWHNGLWVGLISKK